MQDDIRLPALHQRLQISEHSRRQHFSEQVRQIPAENLSRIEPVVLLVGVALCQQLEGHTRGDPRIKGWKAGCLGAGTKIGAGSYGYLMARIRKRLRER